MPSAYALGTVSRNSILDFGVAERLRAFHYPIFTERDAYFPGLQVIKSVKKGCCATMHSSLWCFMQF